MPTRTPSNGLETANQNETFQPESCAIRFVFTLFSQAFEQGHFTKCEILSACLECSRAIRAMPSCYQPTIRAQRYAAIRQTSGLSIVNPTAMLETKGPVKCLSVEIGTRSKRNFHRPESNCGVAINSVCEVFMLPISRIGRSTFQRCEPPWNAARLDGQALFPAGSDFPERIKVFLHESLRALIGPIQADT